MNSGTTVLITSAGVSTAGNIISALKNQTEKSIKIVAVDINPLAAGLYLSDRYYLVPKSTDEEYIPKILDICDKEKVDIILPLHSSETLIFSKNINQFKNLGIKIQLSNVETVEICTDKYKFYKFLMENNFSAPKTFLPNDLNVVLESVDIDFPLFIKPRVGSSSKNTFKIDNKQQLDFFVETIEDPIIQEFLSGQEYTVDLIADEESNVVAAVPRERLEVKDGKAVKCRTIKNDDLFFKVADVVKKIKLSGPANIQFIRSNNGFKIIEINPRFASGGLPLTTAAGVNLPLILIKMLLGEKIEDQHFVENMYMIRYLTEMFLQVDDQKKYSLLDR
ncbi:MAG: ATP-grasp domain-containing protein [Methanosarcinaceae archaeon]|nr:ATP-grasp domain-containing protein [Methanosarcinaceae archaeon]